MSLVFTAVPFTAELDAPFVDGLVLRLCGSGGAYVLSVQPLYADILYSLFSAFIVLPYSDVEPYNKVLLEKRHRRVF
jgi:hypothetical protein